MTVGGGNREDLEESLYRPMLKSAKSEQWDEILLLPSQSTLEMAETLQERLTACPVRVEPLPLARDEDDLDRCFQHFDACFASARRTSDASLSLDFTRGTKVMSAAAVLAATRHAVERFVYVTGPRGARGIVEAGKERVNSVSPDRVRWALRTEEAELLMQEGLYRAAGRLLGEGDRETQSLLPKEQRDRISDLHAKAQFLAAWDRLDYRQAATMFEAVQDLVGDAQRAWVVELAQPGLTDPTGRAAHLRNLAADLLANGERRVRTGQYEDALIRAYRVLELIGQARLFDRGYDSAAMPAENAGVEAYIQKLRRKRSSLPGQRNGAYLFAREQVARFLLHLGDDLGLTLQNFPKDNQDLNLAKRNESVLIHGFEAINPNKHGQFLAGYKALEALLLQDDPAAAPRLVTARGGWPVSP